jgi:hypothetical protein
VIKTEILAPDTLKIVAPAKLTATDFVEIAPQINAIIKQHGTIRLLIDASGLEGWKDIAAFEKHAGFVRDHQLKIERVAVITRHEWQHWLVGAVRVFVHPKVMAFDEAHKAEALTWIAA